MTTVRVSPITSPALSIQYLIVCDEVPCITADVDEPSRYASREEALAVCERHGWQVEAVDGGLRIVDQGVRGFALLSDSGTTIARCENAVDAVNVYQALASATSTVGSDNADRDTLAREFAERVRDGLGGCIS